MCARAGAIGVVASAFNAKPVTILVNDAVCLGDDAAIIAIDALQDAGWTLTPPEVPDDDDGSIPDAC